MGVDVKQLRIGSHILVNGVRARVVQLNTISWGKKSASHVLARGVSPDDGVVREVGCFVDDDAVEPILITPELLEELGFVNTSSIRICFVYNKGCEYDGLWAEVRNIKDRWEVFVGDNDWDGSIALRYLHELEAFLYLTTQTELIPD